MDGLRVSALKPHKTLVFHTTAEMFSECVAAAGLIRPWPVSIEINLRSGDNRTLRSQPPSVLTQQSIAHSSFSQ